LQRSYYGSRRIGKALNALGYPAGRWKIRSLMRETGVQVRRRKKYKVTTGSNHKQPVFENKPNRQFDVAIPNQYEMESEILKKVA